MSHMIGNAAAPVHRLSGRSRRRRRRSRPVPRGTRAALSILSAVLLACVWTACAKTGGPGPGSVRTDPSIEAEHRLWAGATAAHADDRHAEVARLMKRFIARFPRSPRVPEAQWRLGQALESSGELQDALAAYRRLAALPAPSGADPFRQQALQRLNVLRSSTTPPAAVPPGHTAVAVPVTALAGLPDLQAWLTRLRSSGATALMVDASCALPCSGLTLPAAMSGENGSAQSPAALLFATVHAPVARPFLEELVPAAHQAGLSVFAAIDLLHAPWLGNTPQWRSSIFDPDGSRVRQWGRVNLLHPSVQSHAEGLLNDLIRTGVDGVVLRTRQTNSFAYEMSEAALGGFEAEYQETAEEVQRALTSAVERLQGSASATQPAEPQARAEPSGTLWHWIGWKANKELDVLAHLKGSAQKIHPGLRVILEVHPESASEPLSTLVNYGEDVAEATRRGFDLLLNGPARPAEVQQVSALVESTERRTRRSASKSPPGRPQLWVLARMSGADAGVVDDLAKQAQAFRTQDGIHVVVVHDAPAVPSVP